MKNEKKITVMLPTELIERALKATGEGLTPTLRRALELIAAKDAYRQLLSLKGAFDPGISMGELRKDRRS